MSQEEMVGRPMEILLVEDSLLDARVAMLALKEGQVQHRLTLLRDGEEALEFLFRKGKFAQAPRPDLILLDLLMPKKDGREVLTVLKGDFHLKSIPIVVLTASDEAREQVVDEELEVDSFMTKPVDIEKFLMVIRELKSGLLADVILPGA